MKREFCCWVKPYTLFLGKIMPVAYGIKKLQISCKVEDEKCGTDFLEEKITEIEDLVSIITCNLYSFYHFCYCCYYLQMREIVAVMNTTLISSFKNTNGTSLNFFFSSFIFTSAWVVFITAMITFIFKYIKYMHLQLFIVIIIISCNSFLLVLWLPRCKWNLKIGEESRW